MEGENQKVFVKYKNSIVRDNHQVLYRDNEMKVFGFTFNKHCVLSDFMTRPFGWLDVFACDIFFFL